jgi:hypothetical protein
MIRSAACFFGEKVAVSGAIASTKAPGTLRNSSAGPWSCGAGTITRKNTGDSTTRSTASESLGRPAIFRARPIFEGPQSLFLLEDLRDEATNEAHTVSVRDDQIDGRALKVLEIRVKDIDQLLRRYWIDMGRDGHVVRFEAYWTGERLWLRRDIKLAQFGLAGAQIWMPISAEQVTYSPPSASETGESQPESNATISIVNGTMAFNTGLDAKNFAIGFRAVKPNSASGRRRSDQFDRHTQAAERIDAVTRKAPQDLLAQEVEEDPVPKEDIRPESQSGLRYVAYGLAVVAVITFINVWTKRRLRG